MPPTPSRQRDSRFSALHPPGQGNTEKTRMVRPTRRNRPRVF